MALSYNEFREARSLSRPLGEGWDEGTIRGEAAFHCPGWLAPPHDREWHITTRCQDGTTDTPSPKRGRVVRRQDIPNLITVIRLLAVVPLVYLLYEREFGWALVLFALAGVSDGLDGFLAKHYGWQSRLGGVLDPLADKALLLASLLVLGTLGLIPVWLVLAAVMRDLVIVGGALTYHYLVEDLETRPLASSKINTVLQILLVILVIADAGPLALPAGLIALLTYACLFSILTSGIQYVYIWSRKAAETRWRRR